MKENGALDLYIKQNSFPSSQCDEIKASVEFLGWSKTAPLFCIFFLGVVISFPIAMSEYFYRPQKVQSINEEKTKYLEQNTRSFHSFLRSTMNTSENDEFYHDIFKRYLAETQLFLDKLNQAGSNSVEDIE